MYRLQYVIYVAMIVSCSVCVDCAKEANQNASPKSGLENFVGKIGPNENYSDIERALIDVAAPDLADLAKTLRLKNPYPKDSIQYKIWWEQAEFNVPILILSSLFLNDMCQKEHIQTILFSQRDDYHWIKIFQKLFPNYHAIDFMTSRKAYYEPSREYIEYVRSLCQGDFIIVDGQGTGESCLAFFTKYLDRVPRHLAIVRNGSLFPGITHDGWDHIEPLNYAPYGSLITLDSKGPVRFPLEYPVELIAPATACVNHALELLETNRFRSFNQQAINFLIDALSKYEPALMPYHVEIHTQ